MAPPTKGTLHTHTLADGTRAFHLRVRVADDRPRIVLHEVDGCECGCGGGWNEPAARTELGNILARIRVGIWNPPEPSPALANPVAQGRATLFRDYAAWWLEAKINGEIGDRPISINTQIDYRWRLSHILPHFGHHPIGRIDADHCQAFKAHKLREARELREAIAAGAELRDQRGRRIRPLDAASLRKLIDTLAAVLDEAVEDRHIDSNPARGRRMKIYVPKPKRTFLEMDELAALIDAAADQDRTLPATRPERLNLTARLVAHHLDQGLRPHQIARRLEISRSTVAFHTRRLHANIGRGYIGHRVVIEILGRSGVRASELCDIRLAHVRVHDPDGARFHIPDSKTESGVREVQMTPDLVEAVIDHIDRLQRAGYGITSEDHLVQNLRGGRMDRQRIGTIVKDAAALANQRLTAHRLPPLPNTTPHSLRRTYISIALLANNFDVKWVMNQVGHADSKMTMDVYAQLEQRAHRTHGTNFDKLLRQARNVHEKQFAGVFVR